MSELPKIIPVHADTKNKPNAPKYFNEILDSNTAQAYLFLSQDVVLQDQDAYKKITTVLDIYPEVSCVYSDCILKKGNSNYKLYYPTYKYDVCNSITINTPIACRSNVEIRFDESLKHLYLFDFMYRLFPVGVGWHIAEALFTISTDYSNTEIQEELKRITNE